MRKGAGISFKPQRPKKALLRLFSETQDHRPWAPFVISPARLAVLLSSFCTARLRSACGLHPQPDPGGLGRVTEPSCVPVASLDFVVPWSSLSSCSGLSCLEERRLSIPVCPHSSPLYRTVLPQKGSVPSSSLVSDPATKSGHGSFP